ncbi:MAG: hypothetical protein LBJ72_11070 [Dysgonamonadaceae bacterium]|jgi:tetratricopeptide (TPR) repeat protein|nr:hypothetical protein [Dysgonamonadaceae bacterium]
MLFNRKKKNLRETTAKDLMSAVFDFLKKREMNPVQKEWDIYLEKEKMGVVFFENDPYYFAIIQYIPFQKEDEKVVNYWCNKLICNHKLVSWNIDGNNIMFKVDSQVFNLEDAISTFITMYNSLLDASKVVLQEINLKMNPSTQPDSSDIDEDFEKGISELKAQRPSRAIRYFKKVYYLLSQLMLSGDSLNKRGTELFYDSAYFIGYTYVELGSLDEAYRYLETASASDFKKPKYIKEFANCLSCLKDARSMKYIDFHIDKLLKKRKSTWSEDEINLYNFLWRRKAYVFIDLKQYEQAEELLMKLLIDDPNNKTIWNELEYIKEIKKTDNETNTDTV